MTDKPCPFCKSAAKDGDYEDYGTKCSNPDCDLFQSLQKDNWNTRPIEDAQAARIAELEEENALLRQALADAQVPASATELAEKSLEVILLRSRLRKSEAQDKPKDVVRGTFRLLPAPEYDHSKCSFCDNPTVREILTGPASGNWTSLCKDHYAEYESGTLWTTLFEAYYKQRGL